MSRAGSQASAKYLSLPRNSSPASREAFAKRNWQRVNKNVPDHVLQRTSTAWELIGSFHEGLSQLTLLDRSVRLLYRGRSVGEYCGTPLSMASKASMNSYREMSPRTDGRMSGFTLYSFNQSI